MILLQRIQMNYLRIFVPDFSDPMITIQNGQLIKRRPVQKKVQNLIIVSGVTQKRILL